MKRLFSFQYIHIFYIECLVNSITLLLCLLAPKFFINQLINPLNQISAELTEFTRWYGVLLLVLTFVFIRALISREIKLIKFVLEGYLIGDVLQIIVSSILAIRINKWTSGITVTIGITIILMIARIMVLTKTEMIKENNKTTKNI